ncbi:hypothetical protein ASPVEDRAFT_23744 [Aspergillus versicolor CBS 583.65]|uniref:Uncharacterized protein n=1 Tax=Aspergillus versicolor CBS 583.65 TaxID=1036611 RepID=A0A1L9P5P7_ASPVE|nr:uncharacterized protein ASPVEDRAFT_23744 [Aspergillus versicolor CBS 583.65]OJI96753.1 hypothetical protein ASPVEDRAFT_23744 [Aspergillus versicolor CBS 583.65]
MSNCQTVAIWLSFAGTFLGPIESHLGVHFRIRADNPTIQRLKQEVKSQLVLKGYLPKSGGYVYPAAEDIVVHVPPEIEFWKGGDKRKNLRTGDEVTMQSGLEVECSLRHDMAFVKGVSVV